jgi:predicted transposase/invertase (TIGR01784 family)
MSKINPKIDLVFKKLFGSEENKDILLSLINAILPLHQQIAEISLKNPYNVSDYAEGKLSILDIKAQDENGVQYDIEMQIRGSDFYGKRALFYWAKMFGSQLDYVIDESKDKDKDVEIGYSDLKKCIVISLMDFNYFEDKKYNRYFTLKDGETNETHKGLDYLDLYFIELKKFKGKLQTVKTTLERWITFLNNAHKYTKDNLPQELAEIKEIRKASLKLDTMYLDEKEKSYYEGQQKFLLDENSRLKEAVEKAGIEAKTQEKNEIAKKLIRRKLTNEEIAEDTGLTLEQIEKLRAE